MHHAELTYLPETSIDKTIESVDGPFDHDRLSIGSAFCVCGALHPAAKLQILFTSIRKVKHSIVIRWKSQQMTANACLAKLLQRPKIEYQHVSQWCSLNISALNCSTNGKSFISLTLEMRSWIMNYAAESFPWQKTKLLPLQLCTTDGYFTEHYSGHWWARLCPVHKKRKAVFC